MLLPQIGLRDKHSHRVLIESHKAATALQVFQVAANRAVLPEVLGLRGADEASAISRLKL